MKHINKNKMESGRRMRAETDFEQIIVVRGDAETREEAVNHQVNVLGHRVGTSGEWFRWVEKQGLH
jgi:hypothetical protein